MGAWSKMMTAPQFHGQPTAAHMAAALEGKFGAAGRDLLDKEDKLLESPNHPEDLASFKALSNDDDLNGTSDLDSEVASENDEEVPPPSTSPNGNSKNISQTDNNNDNVVVKPASLESTHREIMEKLKRQEDEEIERELLDVHGNRDSILRKRRHSDDDNNDVIHSGGDEDSKDNSLMVGKDKENNRLSPVSPMEIKMQRPMGLLAQHGITTKSHLGLNLSTSHHSHPSHHHSSNNNNMSDSKDSKDILDAKAAKEREEHEREMQERIAAGLIPSTPLDFTHPAFLERQFSHGMRQGPPSPPDIGLIPNGDGLGTPTGGHHWTFEEQFKQLYELSEDTKRKEFLDDLFSFMQKRGTPVNRIPIMAKQPLDLYELFRLVVSKGGLVEVINKKLWREICKGLNLPSSITSAAFTLRTQYMKYLYPYECDKLKLSNPAELQAAIDGNRREGRRPGYGYDFSPIPTMIPPSPQMNGMFNMRAMQPLMGEEDPLPSPPPHIRSMAEREHLRAMEAAHHVMEEAKKRMEEAHHQRSNGLPSVGPMLPLSKAIPLTTQNGPLGPHHHPPHPLSQPPHTPTTTHKTSPHSPPPTSKSDSEGGDRDGSGPPPPKRMASEEDMIRERFERFMPPPFGIPSTHLKITSRNDGRSEFDNSLVVSMEVNGIMYQGVLFAQHPRRL